MLRSIFSRLLPSIFHNTPRVHVCGFLDFVVLRELLGARDDLSKWMCGTSGKGFLLGNPACDRTIFTPPPFEEIISEDPETLCGAFLDEVSLASTMLQARDTLLLVLVGHGNPTDQSFMISNGSDNCYKLTKKMLEQHVRRSKGNVVLITTACFSGSWESKYWTLLAAAGAGQEAVSIVQSGSGEHSGDFANALLEFAHKFQNRPSTGPMPGSLDENHGCRSTQQEHDFGPEKPVTPPRCIPIPCLRDVLAWIHRFRDDFGRTYTSADVIFSPCTDEPHLLPFASLASSTRPFHRLCCAPASDHASLSLTSHSHPLTLPTLYPPEETPESLSESEERELVNLAADHQRFMPISTASETHMIQQCWMVLYGPQHGRKPLDIVAKRILLTDLRNRVHVRELALAIASNLGWSKAIEELGGPSGKQMQMPTMYDLQSQANAAGCLVSSLVVYETKIRRWGAAAGWLARIWEASGRPRVTAEDWEMAIKQTGLVDTWRKGGWPRFSTRK